MPKKKSVEPESYPRGKHPNSLKNLTGKGRGRTPDYDEPKKTREVSVTETGWLGAKAIAFAYGCSSVSELLERLGRGELTIADGAVHDNN